MTSAGAGKGLDYVAEAIRAMRLVADLVGECNKFSIEKCEKKDKRECEVKGEGVARRAKDLPSMVASAGLVPALTFYMSKASRDLYPGLYGFLKDGGDAAGLCSQQGKNLTEELGEKEGAGYTVMLAVSALFLYNSGYLYSEPSDYRSLAEGLQRLSQSPIEAAAAERLLLEYLIEAKKLAEAFFK